MSYSEVNYVVEVRRPGRPWLGMSNTGSDEGTGRLAYDSWRASSQSVLQGGVLEVRLVKRTAVITDEILETASEEEADGQEQGQGAGEGDQEEGESG